MPARVTVESVASAEKSVRQPRTEAATVVGVKSFGVAPATVVSDEDALALAMGMPPVAGGVGAQSRQCNMVQDSLGTDLGQKKGAT